MSKVVKTPLSVCFAGRLGVSFLVRTATAQSGDDHSQPVDGKLQLTGEYSQHTGKHSRTTNDYSHTRDDGSRHTNTNSRITNNDSQAADGDSPVADDDSHAAENDSLIENNQTQENFEKWKLVNKEN